MNKTELIAAVAEKTGMSKKDTEAVITAALNTVTATVNSQRDVIRQGVENAVRKQVTEGVLAAAGLDMTADQYEAAAAAGQIAAEVQAQVSSAVSTQMSGMQSTVDQKTEEQTAALIESNMKSEEVVAQIAEGKAKIVSGRKSLEALKTQLDSYNTFYQGILQYTDGVDQASAGAKDILGGTDTLKSGTGSLKNGTEKLKNGTDSLYGGAGQLKSGTDTLGSGTKALKDGSSKLKSGAVALDKGAEKAIVYKIDIWAKRLLANGIIFTPSGQIRIVSAAIIRVVPDPCMTRLKISRPNLSVPNRCAREGPCSFAELILVGG